MPSLLELRWEYTPRTLFEERFVAEFDGCRVCVDEGVVIVTLPFSSRVVRSPQRTRVESYVEALFLGVQVATHADCQLARPSVSTLNEDGSRGHIIECEPGILRITGGRVDVVYTQSDGTVVDTRRERVERKHRLSRSAALYSPGNEALGRMLRSYRSAIADKDDELIHLYEVLDTLTSEFGSQTAALRSLGMPKRDWSRLGQLCNDLPLREGRHRGRLTQPIRNASSDELDEARRLSASFIESYMKYLERTNVEGAS